MEQRIWPECCCWVEQGGRWVEKGGRWNYQNKQWPRFGYKPIITFQIQPTVAILGPSSSINTEVQLRGLLNPPFLNPHQLPKTSSTERPSRFLFFSLAASSSAAWRHVKADLVTCGSSKKWIRRRQSFDFTSVSSISAWGSRKTKGSTLWLYDFAFVCTLF